MKKFQISYYTFEETKLTVAGRLVQGDISVGDVFNKMHLYNPEISGSDDFKEVMISIKVAEIKVYGRTLLFMDQSLTGEVIFHINSFDFKSEFEKYFTPHIDSIISD